MLFTLAFEGNLADEPELRFTPNGKAICKLRVAHNTRRRTTSGDWADGPTMWVTVTAWEALAERIAEHLHRGDTVIVDARDDLSVWAYLNQASNSPAGHLQVTAANVALSLRFHGAASQRAGKPATADTFDDDRWAATATEPELEPAS